MKTLFLGGVKSGKSRLAETFVLQQYKDVKPSYLATTECLDDEIKKRIQAHQQRRQNLFVTLEEPVKLLDTLQQSEGPVLIECITMWMNNLLFHKVQPETILHELEEVLKLPSDLILVHNEVGLGIIADNPLARQFVDLSGKAGQLMGQYCEQVFFCSAGLQLKMK